jgi:hypothetical protein
MNVVGFLMKEITAHREEKLEGNININNKVNLKDVEEDEIPSLGRKCLIVKYEFSTEYLSPRRKKLAEIKIRGDVLLLVKNPSKIVETWKKEKKLPEELNFVVMNYVLKKGILKAMTISEDLQLPPPIPMPVIRASREKDTKEMKYIQ